MAKRRSAKICKNKFSEIFYPTQKIQKFFSCQKFILPAESVGPLKYIFLTQNNIKIFQYFKFFEFFKNLE